MQLLASGDAAQRIGGNDTVRELLSRLPPVPPVKPSGSGVTTETVTKTTFSETTVKRVTNAKPARPHVEVREDYIYILIYIL